MPTEINCPSCKARLNLPDEFVGQTVKCPTCETQFVAEKPATPAERAAPSAVPPPVPTPPPPSYQPPLGSYPLVAEDDYPRRRPRLPEKPGTVQAASILLLIGGIVSLLYALGYAGFAGLGSMGLCCLYPGWIYAIVAGIMAIVKSSQMLGENAHLQSAPIGIAIMLIICIVNMDPITCVIGIVALVLLNDQQAKAYFQG